jgi:hypothetical protein
MPFEYLTGIHSGALAWWPDLLLEICVLEVCVLEVLRAQSLRASMMCHLPGLAGGSLDRCILLAVCWPRCQRIQHPP